MTLYELSKLGHDIYCDERIRDLYKNNKEKALSEYKLSGKELDAIRKRDVGTLQQMGLNPFLLWHLAQLDNVSARDYIKSLKDIKDNKGKKN